MVLTQAQQHDAYREARDILKLGQKWQELMPGEKRPNFERAAREVLKRALGHKIERNEQPLALHSGEMHEHAPREAALVERYLRSGTVHPDALHSFHGRTRAPEPEVPEEPEDDLEDLPDFDLYIQNLHEDKIYPAHYVPGSGHLPARSPRRARGAGGEEERARRHAAAQRLRSCALSKSCFGAQKHK